MNVILLSGGSGKRLWPLSNDIRSKQFIKIFKNENGKYESMLERMYKNIKKVNNESIVTIATSQTQVSTIANQIGKDVEISVEPCRMDTFPAIVLAISYLHDIKNFSLDETVVVCPVDPYVDNDYFIAKELVKRSIDNGTIEKYLHKVPVHKDDLFYIKSGTIHAIGAGTLIVEIQENSNLTYRVYDYNRVDKTGKSRELHIDKALSVMNYEASQDVKQPIRVYKYKKGYSTELLCRCKYFEVHKEKINTENCKEMFCFQTQSNSFHVLLCIGGCGTLISKEEIIHFFKGDCIFIPANSVELKIHGIMELLNINC